MQPKLVSNQKETLSKFYVYFTTYAPDYDEKDIEFLLIGTPELKGLIQCVGNTNMKSSKANTVKKSAKQALLLLKLLLKPWDPTEAQGNKYYEKYVSVLPKVPLRALQAMKLEKQILLTDGNAEDAFWMIKFLSEKIPDQPKEQYVTHLALQRYEEWLNRSADAQGGDGDYEEDDDDDERNIDNDFEPRRWADLVELEDVEAEEEAQRGLGLAEETGAREDVFLDPLGQRGNCDKELREFNRTKKLQQKQKKKDEGALLRDPTAFE
eukprot:g16091.t1